LSDLRMPGRNGFELLVYIQDFSRSYPMKESLETGSTCGRFGFMFKNRSF
jgi:hypothetical protein